MNMKKSKIIKFNNQYRKHHDLFTKYAVNYADNLFHKAEFNQQLSGELCDFLYDASLDQLYDACLFVNEKEADSRYGGVKDMPTPNAEMEETYKILLKHFYLNLRNRLYDSNTETKKKFFNGIANERENVTHSIQDLQKTYTECYGVQTNGTVGDAQRNLQRELSTYQGKATLLQQIMGVAAKMRCQNQDQGLEQ